VLAEYVEVETGKGANALYRHPALRRARKLCKMSGATLLIAKLDRLARNVHFVSGLMVSEVKRHRVVELGRWDRRSGYSMPEFDEIEQLGLASEAIS
jgi:hypothetical protein